jgi:hypothetical protein
MLEWDRYGFHKNCAGSRYAELVFWHPLGSAGDIVHSGLSGRQNINAMFFFLEWDRCGFHKKRTGTRYAELVFLHSVGSAGHVVHSGSSEPQNFDTLFFMLSWAWCGFHKKCAGTCYANLLFLHSVGSTGYVAHSGAPGHETSTHYFSWSGGGGAVSIKCTPGQVTLNLYFFASDVIYG